MKPQIKLISVSFSLDHLWMGIQSRTYREIKEDRRDIGIDCRYQSEYGKDLVSNLLARSYWCCPILFLRFHWRTTLRPLSSGELSIIEEYENEEYI